MPYKSTPELTDIMISTHYYRLKIFGIAKLATKEKKWNNKLPFNFQFILITIFSKYKELNKTI